MTNRKINQYTFDNSLGYLIPGALQFAASEIGCLNDQGELGRRKMVRIKHKNYPPNQDNV